MNKKSVVVTSIIVSILVLGTIVSSYAYFQSRLATGSSTPTTVKANTISGLTFNAGSNINLLVNQTNMASGASDISKSTEETVTLKSRNDASDNYNYKACLNISSNNFIHSAISSTSTTYGKTKNLFDISKIKTNTGKTLTNNGDGTLSIVSNGSSAAIRTDDASEKFSDYCPSCEAGKTYTLSASSTGTAKYIYFKLSNFWNFGTSRTLTQNDLDSRIYFYSNAKTYDNTVVVISDFQLEEGSTATPYDQYGYIASPELVLTVIKNGTTVLTQDIASTKKEICVPITNGGTTLTHNISASANSTTTDTWKATITFKNLSTNQNVNTNKELNANFVFTKM